VPEQTPSLHLIGPLIAGISPSVAVARENNSDFLRRLEYKGLIAGII